MRKILRFKQLFITASFTLCYDDNQCIVDIFGMSAKKCKTSSVETERLKGTPWDETFSMLSILKI